MPIFHDTSFEETHKSEADMKERNVKTYVKLGGLYKLDAPNYPWSKQSNNMSFRNKLKI